MFVWICSTCGEGDIGEYISNCPFCSNSRDESCEIYATEDFEFEYYNELDTSFGNDEKLVTVDGPFTTDDGIIDELLECGFTDDLMYNLGVAVHERDGGYVPILFSYMQPCSENFLHKFETQGTFHQALDIVHTEIIRFIEEMEDRRGNS